MRRDKLVGVFAESFSQKPFDPVADVGFSVFFADAYSHPRPFGGEIEDRKRGSITPLPFGKEFLKLFVFFHSEIAHEAPDRSAKTSASAADVLKIRNPTKKACGKNNEKVAPDQAESFFLPLFLLLFRTFLPPWLAILFLKPCTLLLCLFLG